MLKHSIPSWLLTVHRTSNIKPVTNSMQSFSTFSSLLNRYSPNIRRFSSLKQVTTVKDFEELRWKKQPAFIWKNFADLSKIKLSSFVLMTTAVGYILGPMPFSTIIFTTTSVGTFLCICSANIFNQWLESPYDSQMGRTRSRVLVRHAMEPKAVFFSGVFMGVAGVGILSAVNPIVSALGFMNIFLVFNPLF